MVLLSAHKLLNLLTRENITLALSIFGAAGTLFTFITSYMSKRKNLKVQITKSSYRTDAHMLLITLTFENRSMLPIAITSIKCFVGKHELTLLNTQFVLKIMLIDVEMKLSTVNFCTI